MLDAENARFVEERMERSAEGLRRRQVTAEGLLDDNPRAARAARLAEPLDHLLERTGRDGEVVQRMRSTAEFHAERGVGSRSTIVTADVVESLLKLREDRLVKTAVLLNARARSGSELLDRPVGPCTPMTGTWRCPRCSIA